MRHISDEGLKLISAGGKKGRKKRAANARARAAALPPPVQAALDAFHIEGDPSTLISNLRGWDFEPAPAGDRRPILGGPSILGGPPPTLRPFIVDEPVRAADDALIGELGWEIGDPSASEPLHLIPLHVAVIVLRQWADAVVAQRPTSIYQQAVHALTLTARDLAKGHGKPTTPLEVFGARANCDCAIDLLRAFDNVPAATKALLGRCQNPRCPRKKRFRVGLEKRPDHCSETCRVRLSEARTVKAHNKKKHSAFSARSSR